MVYYLHEYVIQWDRVKTFEDVKRILQVMAPAFDADHDGISAISDLCELRMKEQAVTVMD
jgi:hypothetical protein